MGTLAWLIAVLLFVCFLAVGVGCSQSGSGGEAAPQGAPPAVRTAEQLAKLDRKHVRELLQRLAKTPPPASTKFGAMCYKPAPAPQRAEYVCPKCGERTLYEKEAAIRVEWEVNACRREFAELRKVAPEGMVLDESPFCRKCCPDAKEPRLVLRVTYDDQKPHATEGVTAEDLRLVQEFLAGKLIHTASNDAETPLQKYLPRLETLLGTKAE